MGSVTFSKVCHAFRSHSKKGMSEISRRLLNAVIDAGSIKDERGNPYSFQNKELIQFFKGELSIYSKIKRGALAIGPNHRLLFHFEDACEKLVPDDKYDHLLNDLKALMEDDDTISSERKNEILSFGNDDLLTTGAAIFLYSLSNENKTSLPHKKQKKTMSAQDTQAMIVKLFSRLPRPVQLVIPDNITPTEMTYVSAILEAFAEDAGVDVITQGDLASNPEYQKYKERFDRHRADYYKAESIRESLKDTELEKKAGVFKQLEDETYEGIVDTLEDDYDTSYKRMTAVLKHVTTVQFRSLLAEAAGWLGNAEKKGVCHILVNEERIKWKQ